MSRFHRFLQWVTAVITASLFWSALDFLVFLHPNRIPLPRDSMLAATLTRLIRGSMTGVQGLMGWEPKWLLWPDFRAFFVLFTAYFSILAVFAILLSVIAFICELLRFRSFRPNSVTAAWISSLAFPLLCFALMGIEETVTGLKPGGAGSTFLFLAVIVYVGGALFVSAAVEALRPDHRPPGERSHRRSPRFSWLTLAVLFFLLLASAIPGIVNRIQISRARDANEGVNIVFVGIDTLRADHLGCYGFPDPTSPCIDGLAREGFLFSDVTSQSHWTLPSFMSAFTSTYPSVHGLVERRFKVADDVVLLSEILQSEGYYTAAIIGNGFVTAHFGYARGFDYFNDYDYLQTHAEVKRRAVEKMLPFLSTRNRFFLFLHLYDPHEPYDPPGVFKDHFTYPWYRGPDQSRLGARDFYPWCEVPPDQLEERTDLYNGEIAYVDFEVGKIVAALKSHDLWDKTLFVIMSDHGEEFREHGSSGHSASLHRELIHVPLVLRDPGLAGSGISGTAHAMVMNIDIAPTILDAAGIAPPETFMGRSLIPVMKGETDRLNDYVFAETSRIGHELRMASSDRHRLITHLPYKAPIREGTTKFPVITRPYSGSLFFDHANDPGEENELLSSGADPPDEYDQMKQELNDWMSFLRRHRHEPGTAAPSRRELENLRALGYIR